MADGSRLAADWMTYAQRINIQWGHFQPQARPSSAPVLGICPLPALRFLTVLQNTQLTQTDRASLSPAAKFHSAALPAVVRVVAKDLSQADELAVFRVTVDGRVMNCRPSATARRP